VYVGGSLRLYFDNNVYNRPFDDLDVPRNREEAEVVGEALRKIRAGEITLISSPVVEFEHSLSPPGLQRRAAGVLIELAKEFVELDPDVVRRAGSLEKAGLGGRDALHLAAAERARVDYFVTTDDKLLKRARRIGTAVRVVSPLDLLREGTI
jgi:predicted nucleic acid-binding protein